MISSCALRNWVRHYVCRQNVCEQTPASRSVSTAPPAATAAAAAPAEPAANRSCPASWAVGRRRLRQRRTSRQHGCTPLHRQRRRQQQRWRRRRRRRRWWGPRLLADPGAGRQKNAPGRTRTSPPPVSRTVRMSSMPFFIVHIVCHQGTHKAWSQSLMPPGDRAVACLGKILPASVSSSGMSQLRCDATHSAIWAPAQ